MVGVLVEMICPQHGFERFEIKVIKRFNITSDKIMPKLRSKGRNEISILYIGRNVSYNEAKDYLIDYFHERGMSKEILRVRMLV